MFTGNFTRGGQTLNHRIIMFGQVAKKGIGISIFVSILIFGYYMRLKVPSRAWKQYFTYRKAGFYTTFAMDGNKATQAYTLKDGRVIQVKSMDVLKNPQVNTSVGIVNSSAKDGLWWGLFGGLGLFSLIALIYISDGKKQKETKHERGAELVTGKELKKFVVDKIGAVAAFNAIKLTEDKIPLIKEAETWNTLFVGTTGTGKTEAMKSVAVQVRGRGQKAVVYDRKGSFVPIFYRKNRDWILNPQDSRMPNWNLWSECRDPEDFDAIAETLMPHHISTSDPFWINSARTIFSAACRKLQERGCFDARELLRQVFSDAGDEDKLAELLKGTEAESLVSKDIKQTALGIKATLSTYLKSLLYLPKYDKSKRNFCIRDWVEQDDDSWLFISIVRSRKRAAYRPLISVWADIALQSILDRELDPDRRIWSFFDELPSLQRLASIQLLMAEGREYGSAFMTAVQDINQFRTVYGTEETTLLSLFNTLLFLRVKHPNSAELMAKWLGEREYLESKEGRSYGANTIRDGVNITRDKRRDRIVLPAEIQGLKSLEGYLSMSEDEPIAKIKLKPKKYKKIANSLELRKITFKDIDLTEVGGLDVEIPDFVVASSEDKSEEKPEPIINKPSKPGVKDKIGKLKSEEDKSKKQRKPRNDRGKSRGKGETDIAKQDVVEPKDDEKPEKEIKTVVGYVASPKVRKDEFKQSMVVTAGLVEYGAVSGKDNIVSQTTTRYKLFFFDVLAEMALKDITKGCRLEVVGEYKKEEESEVDKETGEEIIKIVNPRFFVHTFRVLGRPRKKEKPKAEDLNEVAKDVVSIEQGKSLNSKESIKPSVIEMSR